MTLNSSGPISLAGTNVGQSIEIELGGNGTTTISLGASDVRTLAGVPTGQISFSNFYGKSNRVSISYTFTGSTLNASLNVATIGGYISGRSDITVTINSGIYLWSNSISTPGLVLTGTSSGDTVNIINNGYIIGMGGSGRPANGQNGENGGNAMSISSNISLNNANGYIGGGGGGGAGNQWYGVNYGSGGGGGAGGAGGGSSGISGGAGGSIGNYGETTCGVGYYCCGSIVCQNPAGGGGGGRIMPGSRTSYPGYWIGVGGSAGGSGGNTDNYAYPGGSYGGGPEENGGTGNGNGGNGGGGGGWGGSGGANALGQTGGSPGKAIALNGYTATITAGSSRIYGSIS
jgi:hypothetical protein